MTFKVFIITYLAALLFFLILDSIWLGVIAKGYYQRQIGFLMADRVNWPAAFLFYGIFVLGTIIFCVSPAVTKQSFRTALGLGDLLGRSVQHRVYLAERDATVALMRFRPRDQLTLVYICHPDLKKESGVRDSAIANGPDHHQSAISRHQISVQIRG